MQLFSQLKGITGGEVTIDLPDGATVADLLARLYQQYPALEKWDRNILVGAGLDFVERTHVVRPNDQIALMPPVQGG
ncbi:MAG: MoaD/ThiS family protein [Chthoniobacterales bacterium]